MRRTALLLGVMATLGLAVTWELLATDQGSEPRQAPGSIVGAAPAPMATTQGKAPPGEAASNALVAVAAAINERPLFNPTRRAAGQPTSTAAPAVARDGLPRLAGVLVGPGGGRAIFAGADGKSRIAAEGDAVGGFSIRAISPRTVTLSGMEGDRVLRPTYLTAAGANERAAVSTAGANVSAAPGVVSPNANSGTWAQKGPR